MAHATATAVHYFRSGEESTQQCHMSQTPKPMDAQGEPIDDPILPCTAAEPLTLAAARETAEARENPRWIA